MAYVNPLINLVPFNTVNTFYYNFYYIINKPDPETQGLAKPQQGGLIVKRDRLELAGNIQGNSRPRLRL